jgi:SAM-dependent methyltransferase
MGEKNMPDRIPAYEHRSLDELREHYVVEKQLAEMLIKATDDERIALYKQVYRKLLLNVKKKSDQNDWQKALNEEKSAYIKKFLQKDSSVLEYGAWNTSLLDIICQQCNDYKLVDFFGLFDAVPQNCIINQNGMDADVKDESIDIVFEYVFFHLLHPNDAEKHIQALYRMLKKGGVYISVISNSTIGPSDVSRYFTNQKADGLHLKEYTHKELVQLFKKYGFRKFGVLFKINKKWRRIPLFIHVF